MESVARDQILFADDPRVIGYYIDNELGWWNAALFKMTLEQAPSSKERQQAETCGAAFPEGGSILKENGNRPEIRLC
jgi:hypothetical protein